MPKSLDWLSGYPPAGRNDPGIPMNDRKPNSIVTIFDPDVLLSDFRTEFSARDRSADSKPTGLSA